MAVENPPFDVYPGESKELKITVLNQDDSLKPLDMTSAKLIWELYREPQHILLLSKDSEANSTDVFVADTPKGIVQVSVNAADTQSLKLGTKYVYYLKVIDSYGKVSVVSTGGLNIKN